MAGRILTVSTLVALANAKAIVTNNCAHPVYIWSVPYVGSAHTKNLSINPGGHYEEPWHYGTSQHPGIALKISTQFNGIHTGLDEINFAYSVERSDNFNVWIDLSPVRGNAFGNSLAFHTCHGVYESLDIHTSKCHPTDNIELVLCGTVRSSPAKDSSSLKSIMECYDYYDSSDESDDEVPKYPATSHPVSSNAQPKPTAEVSVYRPSQYVSSLPSHQSYPHVPLVQSTSGTTTTVSYPYVSPVKSTDRIAITMPSQRPEHKTEPYAATSKHVSVVYSGPTQHTSSAQYQPPKHSSEHPDPRPTKHTSDKPYLPPTQQTTQKPYAPPPEHTSKSQYGQPKHSTEQPYLSPPVQSSERPYPTPSKPTSQGYHEPPKHTKESSYPSPPKYTSSQSYSPPSHTEEQPDRPPHTTRLHPSPQYTSDYPFDYSVPQRPSYHSHGDRPGPAAKPTGDNYDVPRPAPPGKDRYGRSALVCSNASKDNCSKLTRRSHEYCAAKVVYPNASSKQRGFNNTSAAPRTLTTVPLKTIMRREAAKHQTVAAPAAVPSGNAPTTSAAVIKPKQCIVPFCEPAQPGQQCGEIAKELEKQDSSTHVLQDNKGTCSSFLKARNITIPATDLGHNSSLSARRAKTSNTSSSSSIQRAADEIIWNAHAKLDSRADNVHCARAVCQRYNLTATQCDKSLERAEEVLQNLLGLDFDYTTEDDVCGAT